MKINRKTAIAGVAALGLLAIPASQLLTPVHVQAQTQDIRAPQLGSAPASFAPLVRRVKPAVVSVQVKSTRSVSQTRGGEFFFDMPNLPKGTPFEEFFKQFRRNPEKFKHRKKGRRTMSQGSGFLISADGYIVTNNHVVDDGDTITVILDNGRKYKAKRIGVDKKTDLALLKITRDKPFPFVRFSHKEAQVGDWAIAVGNPFGLGGTVTVGVVSARGRDIGQGNYDDFLQIDAPINKGNSGGPTFNLEGKVIGVNTAIFSRTGGSVGIGFAIPAKQVMSIVADLRINGGVTRGWLGVAIQKVTPDIADSLDLDKVGGVLVADVTQGSPADKAGLRAGDVILQVNESDVKNPRDLARKIARIKPNTKARLLILRDNRKTDLSVRIGRLKGSAQASTDTAGDDGKSLAGLGMTLQRAGDGEDGVEVVAVESGGKADEKGIRAGNLILSINGEKVSSLDDVDRQIEKARKAGKKAILLMVRANKTNRFVALGLDPR